MELLYSPLPEGYFRLLSFTDDSGSDCLLQPYSIDKAPPYVALSYTWALAPHEGEEAPCTLWVNGFDIPVQQNLRNAMEYLAREVRSMRCLFWADAICIHQSDVGERSSQVKIMKEIYEGSTSVFAWLGIPSNVVEVQAAIGTIQRTMETWPEEIDTPGEDDESEVLVERPPVAISEDSDKVNAALKIMTSVFELAYFQRVWTYQEVTTPRPITFWLGKHHFDDIFIHGFLACSHRFTVNGGSILGASSSVVTNSYLALIRGSRLTRSHESPRPLLNLLAEVRTPSCSDPRDKVFATLAHATDVPAANIIVDYSKSLEHVYRDVALFLLDQYGLDTFGLISLSSPENNQDFSVSTQEPPIDTWVPDWRQRLVATSYSGYNGQLVVGDTLYDPIPGSVAQYRPHNNVLELQGYITDHFKLTTLTDIWQDKDVSTEMPRSWYDMLIGGFGVPAFPSEDVERVLVTDKRRTFVGEGIAGDGKVIWQRDGRLQWDLLTTSRFSFNAHVRRRRNNAFLDLFTACYGRRLAVLNNSRLAVLPAAAEVGDEIAAFRGGYALYLIRRSGDDTGTYSFVGECYVDGLMDGSFLEEAGLEGQSAQGIRLV